jgi:uncharacterized membrane protein
VSPSGLIYATIVVLWAVVLVPIWLRRHDEVTESRSVDRFQGAMRTLSRRSVDAIGDRREVLVPRRPAARTMPDNVVEPATAASLAASRRRRVGLIVLALAALVGGLAAFAVVPVWAPAIPLVVLVAFLLRARASAHRVRDRELADRRARAAESRRLRHEQSERELRRAGVPVAPARVPADIERPRQRAPRPVPMPAEPAAAVRAPAVPGFYDAEAERAWDPVPVPLPTYVSAPKAPRSVRIIDLTAPGAWTSGRLADSPAGDEGDAEYAGDASEGGRTSRQAAARDAIVTGELLIERRRAVGD